MTSKKSFGLVALALVAVLAMGVVSAGASGRHDSPETLAGTWLVTIDRGPAWTAEVSAYVLARGRIRRDGERGSEHDAQPGTWSLEADRQSPFCRDGAVLQVRPPGWERSSGT